MLFLPSVYTARTKLWIFDLTRIPFFCLLRSFSNTWNLCFAFIFLAQFQMILVFCSADFSYEFDNTICYLRVFIIDHSAISLIFVSMTLSSFPFWIKIFYDFILRSFGIFFWILLFNTLGLGLLFECIK